MHTLWNLWIFQILPPHLIFVFYVGPPCRDLNRSDSDSSLSLSQVGDRLSAYGSKSHLIKPTSLMYGLSGRADDTVSLHSNGGNRIYDGGAAENVSGSPILMKEIHHMEKSPSLGEINSFSESSRSFSPNSTEPDTPSPTGGQAGAAAAGGKGSSRIPQLSSKKSPLEEDSCSTGEDTDSAVIRKKHPFKIFKKQKKWATRTKRLSKLLDCIPLFVFFFLLLLFVMSWV